jgi:hypothetical protein
MKFVHKVLLSTLAFFVSVVNGRGTFMSCLPNGNPPEIPSPGTVSNGNTEVSPSVVFQHGKVQQFGTTITNTETGDKFGFQKVRGGPLMFHGTFRY